MQRQAAARSQADRPRLIEQSNVAFIGTTDDPIDDLYWHKKIKEDSTIKFTVAPSFRPDKAININKPGFAEYMGKLAAVVARRSWPASTASPTL